MPRRSAAEPARGPGPEVDLAATLENAGRVADYAHHERRLSDYVAGTGIELVEGTGPARFVDPYTMAVGDGRSWQADRIVVAVGGHPGRLPIAGAELALTYTDLRALAALPGRVAVIGGADFGCQTLLLEYAPRLIPRADQDLSAALGAAFTRRGIEVVIGAPAPSGWYGSRAASRSTTSRPMGRPAGWWMRCSSRWAGRPTSRGWSWPQRAWLRSGVLSRSTTGCRPTWPTSSPLVTSTAAACWCPAPATKAASRLRTPCWAPAARSPTRSCPPAASPDRAGFARLVVLFPVAAAEGAAEPVVQRAVGVLGWVGVVDRRRLGLSQPSGLLGRRVQDHVPVGDVGDL